MSPKAAAITTTSAPSRRRATVRRGRPPSDAALTALTACLTLLGEELQRLRQDRSALADGIDKQAMAFNRHLLAEASDRWWLTIDKISAMPAMGLTGIRLKADVLVALEHDRDGQHHVADVVATDTAIRLGLSLADDVRRWDGRRPGPLGRRRT